jgi:tetratricopeptide (TPR) repeat protein
MLGEGDPDAIIADRLSGESPFLATDKMDLNEGVFFDDDAEPAAASASSAHPVPEPVGAPAGVAAASTAPSSAPRSLDQVFEDMREEAGRSVDEEAASEQYGLAITYNELGMVDEAMTALEEAAKSPRQRFEAASMLARLHLERGETAPAIQWFERAAEAPATTPDAGHALLYDLAETLEKTGERARALAIFVELEAESGGYRDVASRINRLSKVQAKG